MWGEYERTNCALHRSRNALSLLISSTACDNCSSNVVYKATFILLLYANTCELAKRSINASSQCGSWFEEASCMIIRSILRDHSSCDNHSFCVFPNTAANTKNVKVRDRTIVSTTPRER